MAPCTIDGFTRGTAPSGSIRHGNPKFISVDGPVPTSIFGLGQALQPGVLNSVAYGGHTLKMAPSGCITKFTYVGGLVPALITVHNPVFYLGNLGPMAHGELTHRMALSG